VCTVYAYWYHFSRSRFFRTIGLTAAIAIASPQMVKTSCALLNDSLSTSNVPDGVTRVQNKSSPYAKTRDVDSSSDGAVRMCRTFATCSSRRKTAGSDDSRKVGQTSHAHGSCVIAHGECRLAARGHTEQAIPPAPQLSVYSSSFGGSTAGGGTIESGHSRSPLNDAARYWFSLWRIREV
jgi:hypothetical protein